MIAQQKLDTEIWHDIGEGHAYKFFFWEPDFSISANAEKWAHLAHLIRTHPIVGATIRHNCHTETGLYEGVIYFRTELTQAGPFKNVQMWDVKLWVPLHIEPSLQSHCPCKDHGYIRGDQWVRA